MHHNSYFYFLIFILYFGLWIIFTFLIGILMIYLALIFFLQIIIVTLYEQLAVRLCLTSILTIVLTGNNDIQKMWGGIAYLDISI